MVSIPSGSRHATFGGQSRSLSNEISSRRRRSSTAPFDHMGGDVLARRWIFAESERVQLLMDDQRRSQARIAARAVEELRAAHVDDPAVGGGRGERAAVVAAALAVSVEEDERFEVLTAARAGGVEAFLERAAVGGPEVREDLAARGSFEPGLRLLDHARKRRFERAGPGVSRVESLLGGGAARGEEEREGEEDWA